MLRTIIGALRRAFTSDASRNDPPRITRLTDDRREVIASWDRFIGTLPFDCANDGDPPHCAIAA